MTNSTPARRSPSPAAARARAAVLCFLAAVLLGTAAVAAVPGSASWTESLTRQALASGFLTRLPPTVSEALGLVKAQEGTDVRQLISKSGHQVRTFNVSVARNSDVVLFTVDARSAATVAYLIGPDGQLRKAVSYQAGREAKEMPVAEARSGLAREARFWSARARHISAAAAPVPPMPRDRQ